MKNDKKKKLILASQSPRRREILSKMGLKFEIIPSTSEEKMPEGEFTPEMIEEIAYKKAEEVAKRVDKNAQILGADTVVIHNKKVLGKPHTKQEAYEMLEELSGITHYVVTGICLIDNSTNKIYKTHTITYVTFNNLTQGMIANYIEGYKPYDKAGSYGIQELPEGFVKNIEGELDNVIGLPSKAVKSLLKLTENY